MPNSDLVIPEGTPIVISLLGLMRDANNFPDPDNYWPDRFAGEQPMYNPAAFLPFGDGPRACIGKTFSLIGFLWHFFGERRNSLEIYAFQLGHFARISIFVWQP